MIHQWKAFTRYRILHGCLKQKAPLSGASDLIIFSCFNKCRVKSLPWGPFAPRLPLRKRFLHVCVLPSVRVRAFHDLHPVIPGPLLTRCWSLLICCLSSSSFPTLPSYSTMLRLLNSTRPNPLILQFCSCFQVGHQNTTFFNAAQDDTARPSPKISVL